MNAPRSKQINTKYIGSLIHANTHVTAKLHKVKDKIIFLKGEIGGRNLIYRREITLIKINFTPEIIIFEYVLNTKRENTTLKVEF